MNPTQGTIVRQRAAAIAQQSRTATGVIVQKLGGADGIKDVAVVPEIDEEGAAAAAAAAATAVASDKVSAAPKGKGADAAKVSEKLRGGGVEGARLEPAWMTSVVREGGNEETAGGQ